MTDTVINLPAPSPPKREIQTVIDAVPILDTARFEHMQRIANIMARSTMIPETLRCFGPKAKREELPFEQVLSNCFLVVNQATRWGMDPFAVISCCSVVHGRLSYEGKLVAAVLDAKLGIQLRYEWDNQSGENLGITVSGTLSDGRTESVTGTVKDWKTSGDGSPWKPSTYRKMLAYRGAREWARLYAPAVMLGVYSGDELEDLAEDARARRAAPVSSLSDRLSSAKRSGDGFSTEHVARELSHSNGGANHSEDPHHAILHDAENLNGTDDHTNPGGGHEVIVAAEVPHETSSAHESNSPDASPNSQAVKPATDTTPSQPPVAGDFIPESSEPAKEDDSETRGGDDLGSAASPSLLPPDWQDIYLTAMQSVNEKPKSLPTRHTEALNLMLKPGEKPSDSEQEWMRAVYRLRERNLKGEISRDEYDAAIREIKGS